MTKKEKKECYFQITNNCQLSFKQTDIIIKKAQTQMKQMSSLRSSGSYAF